VALASDRPEVLKPVSAGFTEGWPTVCGFLANGGSLFSLQLLRYRDIGDRRGVF
jgi:hypothetical protein